jgi:hypothetical protein
MDVGADLKDSQPLAYSLGFLRPLFLPSSASPALACPGFFRFASWQLEYLCTYRTSGLSGSALI